MWVMGRTWGRLQSGRMMKHRRAILVSRRTCAHRRGNVPVTFPVLVPVQLPASFVLAIAFSCVLSCLLLSLSLSFSLSITISICPPIPLRGRTWTQRRGWGRLTFSESISFSFSLPLIQVPLLSFTLACPLPLSFPLPLLAFPMRVPIAKRSCACGSHGCAIDRDGSGTRCSGWRGHART